jgi:small subunit ribosomal protein S3
MGHKINPTSYRTGITRDWKAKWFFVSRTSGAMGLKNYGRFLKEDEVIRDVIKKKVAQAGIASIDIERTSNATRIIILTARPGFVIGRGGKGIEDLNKAIETALAKVGGTKKGLSVNVEELKRTDVSAAYTAQQIAWDIEKRIPFRQCLRKHLEAVMQNRDIKGAKILMSGRLDGAEISRVEWKVSGSLPLQTLRADIDYATGTAFCTYGTVGIKVWLYKGEIFNTKSTAAASTTKPEEPRRPAMAPTRPMRERRYMNPPASAPARPQAQ